MRLFLTWIGLGFTRVNLPPALRSVGCVGGVRDWSFRLRCVSLRSFRLRCVSLRSFPCGVSFVVGNAEQVVPVMNVLVVNPIDQGLELIDIMYRFN